MSSSKKYKIGILGAGQLGLYLCETLVQKNVDWCLFYENENEPAFIKYKKNSIKINQDKNKRALQLALCETVILENEFYTHEELAKISTNFIPDLKSYQHFYGKINQRLFYQSLGLDSPKFWVINDISELDSVDQFPIILKKNLFSYDGNGNRECKNPHELHIHAMELGLPLLAEEKLDLKNEFAVGVVSNKKEWLMLPLTETFQKNHICHYVIGPFNIDQKHNIKLQIEIDKLKKASLFGLFAFEFFITKDDRIIINEGAARPHNSQHLTMNLCDYSQFDYLINLALNPNQLLPYTLMAPMGAMINLLGKKNSVNPKLSLSEIPEDYKYSVYLYGKKEGRIGRKLGHINIINNKKSKEEFTTILDRVYEGYSL